MCPWSRATLPRRWRPVLVTALEPMAFFVETLRRIADGVLKTPHRQYF